MEDLFVPYELAVKLKKLGFDKPCFKIYKKFLSGSIVLDNTNGFQVYSSNNSYEETMAPLWQQAFDWFRYKDLFSYIRVFNKNDYGFSVLKVGNSIYRKELLYSSNYFKSYEEARLSCLEKLIELV